MRRWSRRVRALFDEIRSHGIAWLQHPVRRVLAAFDQELFAEAERTRDHLEQQACFESRHLLQYGRRDFAAAFHDAVVAHFDLIERPLSPIAGRQASVPAVLELVDPVEQERTAVLDKLAARGESRNGSLLLELGYRFAALLGMPPLEGEHLPFGPRMLTIALDRAVEALPQLPPRHRSLLLQSFDGGLMAELEPLYHTINERLIAGGILPQLRAFSSHARSAAHISPTPAAPSPEPLRPVAESIPNEPPRARQHSAPQGSGGMDNAAPFGGIAKPLSSDSLAVLENLRELLEQQRRGRSPIATDTPVASAQELQGALAALQTHLADVTDKATREIRSAQRLREELLLQLNADQAPGAAPKQLSLEHGDAIDLIAMLFEQLGQEVHTSQGAKSVLGQLQLPMLRMAISDRAFFNQREHPARRLLDAVADTARDWMDAEGQGDRELAAQLENLVTRANRKTPSAGLYASLLADIEHHLALLSRKSQMTERRQVEAMQGREKLEQARRRAAALMTERFTRHQPRGLLRVLLERAWSDVLALTLLRHGEDSPYFIERLAITDQLLGERPIDDRLHMQAEIELGLKQIGMHEEEASQVAQRLLNLNQTEPAKADDSADIPAATELALRIKQRPRLGESSTMAHPAASKPAAAATAKRSRPKPSAPAKTAPELAPLAAEDLSPVALAVYQRLLQTPFGTWFEQVQADGSDGPQRKLAWYSPVSDRCLLLTRRGLRAEDLSLPEVAREIADGRLRELVPARESLLDRAWSRVTSNLKRLGLGDRHPGVGD